MATLELYSHFPSLTSENHRITSPEDIDYNCIAWAAGDTERWWWPSSAETAYWPDGIPLEETRDAFIAAFRLLGYEICETFELENGVEKVAFFEARGKPAHAARQLPNGAWASKLGELQDIEHDLLEGVEGEAYGRAVVFMGRPRP